ncbi:MAG: hypothetical protein ABH811_02905 [archaeon]
MVKKIQVNLSNKVYYTFTAVLIATLLGVIVYAYNPSGTGGVPSVMGHSIDEIDFKVDALPNPASSEGMVLYFSGDVWVCDGSSWKRILTEVDSTSIEYDLYGGKHSSDQCTARGGTVVTEGGNTFCRFNLGSCPGAAAGEQAWSPMGWYTVGSNNNKDTSYYSTEVKNIVMNPADSTLCRASDYSSFGNSLKRFTALAKTWSSRPPICRFTFDYYQLVGGDAGCEGEDLYDGLCDAPIYDYVPKVENVNIATPTQIGCY